MERARNWGQRTHAAHVNGTKKIKHINIIIECNVEGCALK
jgi:hypothetical protein